MASVTEPSTQKRPENRRRKTSYHHGDLREALISTAYHQVATRGEAAFSITDACKQTGVTAAALYRHFTDRDDLLRHVCRRGFSNIEAIIRKAKRGMAPGSIEAICEVGLGYVAFARQEPEVFRIMCSKPDGQAMEAGASDEGLATFMTLLEEIIARYGDMDRDRLFEIGFNLWTFVHGAAHLAINDSYGWFKPDHDVDAMVREMTPRLLPNLPVKSGCS